MADNIAVTPGTGATVAADEIADGTLGTVKVQYVKLMDGTLDSSNKLVIDASGAVYTRADVVASTTSTNYTGTTTSGTLLAANASRRGLYIYNDSTANLFVKLGATASTTSFTVKLGPGDFWEMPTRPTYTGIVTGLWDAANGAARLTEF